MLEARPLAPASMVEEPNALVQLYTEDRTRLVEALMFPCVLVPEGRVDYSWLRVLLDVVETGAPPLAERGASDHPPFGAMVGVVPTRDSHVRVTVRRLLGLHGHVAALVDGDDAGNEYVRQLARRAPRPTTILQWPDAWEVEQAVCWVLEADEAAVLPRINERLGRDFDNLTALLESLVEESGRLGGLKTHYIAHEEIAGAMKASPPCVERAAELLGALTLAVTGGADACDHLLVDGDRARGDCQVIRFVP